MQLPDETVEYHFQNAMLPPSDGWTPLAELQAKNLLPKSRLQVLIPGLTLVRGQVAAEREVAEPRPDQPPLQAGFIDLPQKLLDAHRRKGETSELGRILALATKLREETDRVIVLGIGGSYMGARALFEALNSAGHNELPAAERMGKPRMYFEGNGFDNDSLQDLLDLLENTCVDPDIREERWGVVVISKSGEHARDGGGLPRLPGRGGPLLRAQSPRRKQLVVPVTGAKGKLRELCKADGYTDDDILTIPDDVGGRFSVFTAVGLLPAAVMGLDVRASAARRGRHDPAFPRGAVRAQPGPAVRGRQLPDERRTGQARPACCRSGRRSSKRSACGTTSCWPNRLGKQGRGADADDGACRRAICTAAASSIRTAPATRSSTTSSSRRRSTRRS